MRIPFGLFSLSAAIVLAPSLLAFSPSNALASCGPNALGTARTITLDAKKHRYLDGSEAKLGLRSKEVILTFDDGPIAGKTSRILKALKKECVKATFFYVGKMARAYPRLVRKAVNDGHTLAHHTHDHNRLPNYSTAKAGILIDKGVSQIQKIAYGDSSSTPRTPFFRYPYLAYNKRTDRLLAKKGLIAFGANIDALDWKKNSPSTVHDRIMRRLRKQGKGIILMHDIQGRTAKMLPRLLRSLKDEGYKVVHMVPKGTAAPENEPVLVASAEIAETKAHPEAKTKPARSYDTGYGSTHNAHNDRLIVASLDMQADRDLAISRRQNRINSVTGGLGYLNRTGVTVSSGQVEPQSRQNSSALVPVLVARASMEQLKPERHIKKSHKAVPTKRRTRKSKLKRKSFKVAKNSKRGLVKTGNWKLRRSQWILR